MCVWGEEVEDAAFLFGDEAVLFIYVSSGLAGLADSSLHLRIIRSTRSLLNNWGRKTGVRRVLIFDSARDNVSPES